MEAGERIGPYRIGAKVGEGGMGEVYRATDANLGRSVALKVLPEAVAADPQRLARFDREAKTLATLNHPNIAQIYGLERSNGATALVMELVEGPTLGDRIARPESTMMAAAVVPDPAQLKIGAPMRVFSSAALAGVFELESGFDVSRDDRFLVAVREVNRRPLPLTVVLNWTGTLAK